MSSFRIGLRTLTWLGVPLISLVACALGGAALGSVIGGAMGHPEGEGFIGFLYGLYSGGAAGVIVGVFAAWRIDRSLRQP